MIFCVRLHVSFNPDEDSKNYIDLDTNKGSFTGTDAFVLNKRTELCFKNNNHKQQKQKVRFILCIFYLRAQSSGCALCFHGELAVLTELFRSLPF